MRNLPWGTFITCPSAHVASSLAAGLVLLRFQPWVGEIFLFIALSIIVATMAVQSANGGLIPWQAGIATRIGRFQFVLGGEVGLSFYRHGDDQPFLFYDDNCDVRTCHESRGVALQMQHLSCSPNSRTPLFEVHKQVRQQYCALLMKIHCSGRVLSWRARTLVSDLP